MSKPVIRILLLDDHQLFRVGLRMILERAPGLAVVADAGNGTDALEAALRTAPDVVVADIHLPGEDGIEIAGLILKKFPAAKVVFLSSDADVALVRRALESGARGYLLKDNAAQDLLRAIEAAVQGGIYLCPEVAAKLVQSYQRDGAAPLAPPPPRLSERENAVLQLLAQGLRNKEIALRLKVGTKSVETYRSRLMKKLGYQSTAELIRYAIREDLIPP
jgi:DNA-binding NarL/FixJ family response regulator